MTPDKNQRYVTPDGASVYNTVQNVNSFLSDVAKLHQYNYLRNSFFLFAPSSTDLSSWTESGASAISIDTAARKTAITLAAGGYIQQDISIIEFPTPHAGYLEANTDYTAILYAYSTSVSAMKFSIEATASDQVYNLDNPLEENSASVLNGASSEIQKYIVQFRTNAGGVTGPLYCKIKNVSGSSKTFYLRHCMVYKGLIELAGMPYLELNQHFLDDLYFNSTLQSWTTPDNFSADKMYLTDYDVIQSANQVASKKYVDDVAVGLRPKETCNVMINDAATAVWSSTNIVGSTVDGYVVQAGDRVVFNKTVSAAQNGIYVVAAGSASIRATDYDNAPVSGEIKKGDYVAITSGSLSGSGWVMSSPDVTVINVDPITFTLFSNGNYTGGKDINIVGNQINVKNTLSLMTSISSTGSLNVVTSTSSNLTHNGKKIWDDGNINIGAFQLLYTDSGSALRSMGVYNTIYSTIAMGVGAFSFYTNPTITNSIFLGSYSGYKAWQGDNNIGIGFSSLYSNFSGTQNIAIGCLALSGCTTGSGNIALGYSSLKNSTVAQHNVFLGYGGGSAITTGNFNIGMGVWTLSNRNPGDDNIALGAYSQQNANGSGNIGIGAYTLQSTSGGDYNIAIGYACGQSSKDISNAIMIGRGVYSSASNVTIIGNNSVVGTYLQGDIRIQNADPIAYGYVIKDVTTHEEWRLFIESGVLKMIKL